MSTTSGELELLYERTLHARLLAFIRGRTADGIFFDDFPLGRAAQSRQPTFRCSPVPPPFDDSH